MGRRAAFGRVWAGTRVPQRRLAWASKRRGFPSRAVRGIRPAQAGGPLERWCAARAASSESTLEHAAWTYAGPLPEMAVAMSRYFSSSTITSSPKAPSTLATSCLSLSLSSGVPIHTVMPSLTVAGVLGIERTVRVTLRLEDSVRSGVPARMLSTTVDSSMLPASSLPTASMF